MNFRDYQWSKNPRGLHNDGAYKPIVLDRYIPPGLGWVKLVTASDEHLSAAAQLVAQGVTPIIRMYAPRMGADPPPEQWYPLMQQYISVGCRWFETYNEPNQEVEWPVNESGQLTVNVDWKNRDKTIIPLMSNWLTWAERVIQMGSYPAFPGFTETTDPRLATTLWMEACIAALRDLFRDRFVNVMHNGLWCAAHPYLLNHFYQSVSEDLPYLARPYAQEDANGDGWHFEYPYDPLQQRNDPGRTVFGGTALTPYGDPNGLLGTGEIFQQLIKKHFDAGPIPVVGTEGGIADIPGLDGGTRQHDPRYPPYSRDSHAEATMAMWRWIAEESPPWFWGVTLWLESDYFNKHGDPVPAIQRMINEPPILKPVLNVDTTSGRVFKIGELAETNAGPRPTAQPEPGPGPLEGSPDYHWLILAPGLQADWFFQAAQQYWQVFRPTVLVNWRLIRTIPYSKTLAVTVLARSDTIKYMDKRVRDVWPNIYYDALVYDTLAEMQAELDRRALLLKRFG